MTKRRPFTTIIALLAAMLLSAISVGQDKQPSATVEIDEEQISFILNGLKGEGTLRFKDEEHRFKLKGLGIGGVGISKMHTTGEVYNMNDVADFAGTYVKARAGIVVGKGKGVLWLENDKGVAMSLKTDAEGVALMIGVDGIFVEVPE